MSDSRVWLITGTSTGIGFAAVKEVIAAGERVAAITRKASGVAALSAAFSDQQLLVVEYDVGNPNANVEELFEKIHKHFGRVDVVVNNAGYGLNSVVEGTSEKEARDQIEVNFWGPARISREAVKYFREHQTPAGRILNVSSVGGFNANPTLAYYSASKFALEGFSEGLNKELDPVWNIRVIAIQPGGVRTEWAKGSMIDKPLPPAYDSPDSPANKMRDLYKGREYTNDAVKSARALIAISKEADPPLRLPLGADARFIIIHKTSQLRKDLYKWEGITLSTTADDADPTFFAKLSETVLKEEAAEGEKQAKS